MIDPIIYIYLYYPLKFVSSLNRNANVQLTSLSLFYLALPLIKFIKLDKIFIWNKQ